MANNKYTLFPTYEGTETSTNQVTYNGSDLGSSGVAYGDDVTEAMEKLDDAIPSIPTNYDLDNVTVDNVTFGTQISSATDGTDLADKIITNIDSNADKYTQAEVDSLVGRSAVDLDLVSDPTPSIDVDVIRSKRTVFHCVGNNTTPIAFTISATGTPEDNDSVDFMLAFTALDSGSTLTIFGVVIANEILSSNALIRMFYHSGWRAIAIPSFNSTNIIKSNQITDLTTSINTNAYVVASKAITDYITVTGAVNLDSGVIKVTGSWSPTGTYDFSGGTLQTGTPSAGADATNKTYVDAATAKLSYITVTGAIDLDNDPIRKTGTFSPTGTYDFSGGTIKSGTPSASTDVANKSYVDGRTSSITDYIELSSSEIQNLHSTPITLVENPGANKIINILSIVGSLDYNTVAYGGGATVAIQYSTGEDIWTLDASLFKATADEVQNGTRLSNVSLQPATLVNVINSGSAFTTGNSTVRIYVTYEIIDLS